MRTLARHAVRGLGAVGVMAVLATACGCEILAVPEQFIPVKSIPAEYEPADRPTAVLIDDPRRLLPNQPMAGVIAARVAQDLQHEGVITRFIEPRDIDALRLNTPDYSDWAIDRIGRSLGAEQVIFVEVDAFFIPPPGESDKPFATGWVRMVDAQTGQRLYPPTDERGRSLTTELFMKSIDASGVGSRSLVERHLADHFAIDIGKRFYAHKPRAVGSGRDD
jgi:hypothetical protein